NKIQPSCKKKNYLLSLSAECRVGEWKNLENFVITPAGVEFETILSGHLDNNLLIGMFLKHVVGKAIDIGEKLTLQCSNGKEKKKIEFTLRDIKRSTVGSVNYAFDTSQLLINPPTEESAALKEMFKCDKTNMSIVESNDSNNQMVRHENKVIKIDTWDQYDDKTVAELLTSTQAYYNL
ncbi:hypothetical protein HID58_074288, partial [Brassica napus]